MVEIIRVKSKKEIKDFISFEDKLYNGCEFYVPRTQKECVNLFSEKKNPNLYSNEVVAFLAYQEGKLVGRIMGSINRVEKTEEKSVRIDYFDFINDSEVSSELLNTLKKWAVALGAKNLVSSLGFNDFSRSGILIDGFDQLPTYNESYNYPYYGEHLLKFGFKSTQKLYSYRIKPSRDFKVSELYEEMELLLEKNNLKMIYGNKNFVIKNYGSKIFDLLYKNSPTLHPVVMTERVYEDYLKTIKTLFDDNDLCVIVNDFDEVVSAVLLQSNTSLELQATNGKAMMSYTMYNVSVNKVKDLGLLIVGADYFQEDIMAIIANYIMQNLKFKNICYLESNLWINENFKKVLEKWFEFTNHKCRGIFEYKIK